MSSGLSFDPSQGVPMAFPLRPKVKLNLNRSFSVQNCEHLDSSPERGHNSSPQDCQHTTVILLKTTSAFLFLRALSLFPFVFDSPLLARYMSTHPFGLTMYLSSLPSSLPCLCSDQTRAERLILALRPSKISQPRFFPPLSLSIWSNMLPGCRYGHQRGAWYFWPLRAWN